MTEQQAQDIADVWNHDNEANGVPDRWEPFNDRHPAWPWTIRKVQS